MLGKLRATVGKAHLLTSKKFRQFRDLCERNLVSVFDRCSVTQYCSLTSAVADPGGVCWVRTNPSWIRHCSKSVVSKCFISTQQLLTVFFIAVVAVVVVVVVVCL